MRTLLTYLPAVACLAMLVLVCGPMLLRHNKGQSGHADQPQNDQASEVAQLREEVAILRAEFSLKDDPRTLDRE